MKPPSYPYFVTTKGSQEEFPGKGATGFQSEVATPAGFCVATIPGLCLFHWKGTMFISDVPCQQTHPRFWFSTMELAANGHLN